MRIAAISDQHGRLPVIPPCDLLIVAGDICPDRIGRVLANDDPDAQKAWFDSVARPWLAGAPAAARVLTWGNHDWCGERCRFNDTTSDRGSAAVQILVDAELRVPSTAPGHPPIRVWATPWSNLFMQWAFMKEPQALAAIYDRIPHGIDILVSHQPPHGYGDLCNDPRFDEATHIGSRELLKAIERVRPRLVICGHIHEGFGRYEHDGIPICNVSVVDERYRWVHPVTEIDF